MEQRIYFEKYKNRIQIKDSSLDSGQRTMKVVSALVLFSFLILEGQAEIVDEFNCTTYTADGVSSLE